MERLSKDEIVNIAFFLDLNEILALCQTNSKINRSICQNKSFWLNKLQFEFPNYQQFNLNLDKNYYQIYKKLHGISVLKKKLNLEGSLLDIYNQQELD